ncbi:MAG: ATP-binding protein [Longimicrobiaceae bacterium]
MMPYPSLRRLMEREWLLPLLVLIATFLVLGLLDRQQAREAESMRQQAARQAERRASSLADAVGNTVSSRIGALRAAKVQFTQVSDSVSEQLFAAAVDSATSDLSGLTAISVIYPDGRIRRGGGANVGRFGADVRRDPVVRNPYRRALASGEVTASGVLDLPAGRRVFVFEPVVQQDSSAVLVAELDPGAILRAATARLDAEIFRGSFYALYGPNNEQITAVQAPSGWSAIEHRLGVADTEWTIRFAYEPIDEAVVALNRFVRWVLGLAVGVLLATFLYTFRRQINVQKAAISRQREEIVRRKAAERESRGRADQLVAAQKTAQRLSTSLDPDDVLELFLGEVAEAFDAEVASLYTFAEEGEVIVGRKRLVFRDTGEVVDRLRAEDIGQVRAPVELMPPWLVEAISSGKPFVSDLRSAPDRDAPARVAGVETASALVAIPLMVRGHIVGVAAWEVFSEEREFDRGVIGFAQALAATAAASLHTAELFSELEEARLETRGQAVRLSAIVEQMADGVVVVDKEGRVERSNQAARELLGEELSEVRMEEWASRFDLATADGKPYPMADFPLVRALRGERVERTEFGVSSPWGDSRQFAGSAAPVSGDEGQITGAALVFRDVSDERQYAEMLRHTNRQLRDQADLLEAVNRQLREATQAKDQFLAVMSHELRTPINAVIGYTDLLDMELKGGLNPDQKAMLARIRETSGHLLGLINQVLDLAKIGAGQLDVVLTEVDAARVLDKCVDQLSPLAEEKGLDLVLKKGVGCTVLADETRLTQIVLNLLSNAIKFTDRGEARVSCRAGGDQVAVRVEDTGPGIREDQREKIFEEFYQSESDLTRKQGGAGLGLPIARRLARMMGGEVELESDGKSGSTFTLRLPTPGARARKDDQAETLTMVALARRQRYLEKFSAAANGRFRMVGTSDAARLGALAREERPALVILDTGSPEHGAWRAISSLRGDARTEAVPVTLLLCDEECDRVSALGPMAVLGKPVAPDRMMALLKDSNRDPERVVVIASHDGDLRRIMGEFLASSGYPVRAAADGTEALGALRSEKSCAVIVDLMMPDGDGLATVVQLRADQRLRQVPLIALIPRELSPAEMEAMQHSADAALRRSSGYFRPLREVLAELLPQAEPATAR